MQVLRKSVSAASGPLAGEGAIIDADWTYDRAVELAPHLVAIGAKKILIRRGPLPWKILSEGRAGEPDGMAFPANFLFSFDDRGTGLSFEWDFHPLGNGRNKDRLEINVTLCREILENTPARIRGRFLKFLADMVPHMRETAYHHALTVDRWENAAKAIESLL